MSCANNFCAMYTKEDQHYTGWADKSRKLGQWSSYAEPTHSNDKICSEIDSKSWTPNKSFHISYVKCIANNGFMVGSQKYDALEDVEINANTLLKMLNYSAASLEVIELFVFNDNSNAPDFFYSIIFDKFRYKLKDSLDIESILMF